MGYFTRTSLNQVIEGKCMAKERILVLCVDRDNDLGSKTKRTGPIIGREANVASATALLMKDPEDTDGNAMFMAVNVFDDMQKKKAEVQVVTITGDERLGYDADKKVTQQLEKVLAEFPAESCIFISDGANDEEVLPLISSRVKINSKKTVVMRQAKELEKTYLVVLNKLKEPYYARLFFGVPALIILAFFASEAMGFGWKPIIAILGVYLLIKGFGVEESLIAAAKGLILPIGKASTVIYLPVLALTVIALSVAFTQFNIHATEGVLGAAAYAAKSLFFFIPFILALLFVGKAASLISEKKKFDIVDNALYATNGILLSYVCYTASAWIIGDAAFVDFIVSTFIALVIGLVAMEVDHRLKMSIAGKMRLENKEVLNAAGAYLGKVVGVDKKNNVMFLQTPLGHRISVKLDEIMEAEEKITVKR
jgi:putative membrane protein